MRCGLAVAIVVALKNNREQSSVERQLLQKTRAGLKKGNKKPGRQTFRVFCFAA
ncbi:hypothetical protein C4K19_2027 [Pseudomonas chlororaphis subsp. aurantiaca]|nr:hypothetical protein C4K19_2027 [Pseudomonas chlororaphis subsp. aurantiaca]